MNEKPAYPNVQIPAPPSNLESEGGREAIKINLSEALHKDMDAYVKHTGETKSDLIANSLRYYLANNPSWMYRRYFIQPKSTNFTLDTLNSVSQGNQVYLVCTSHPNADYREYICAQVMDSTGLTHDDFITIKPLFYLPQIFGEELTLKSDSVLPEVFKNVPNTPIVSTDLRYKINKKYVWAIAANI
ncbi:hypothetical protein [Acinetobacter seifertii]|jgi:hypothetical protein|uniref:hypothetical protein n=1 Tax=Acinetobacter seifertii TaxID=1530123 RepID=UPI003213257F